jgi:hypothetical protein
MNVNLGENWQVVIIRIKLEFIKKAARIGRPFDSYLNGLKVL